jgi:hypothetical protein
MGIITGILKLPFKGAKKVIGLVKTKEEKIPIIAVAKTNYPKAYEYYFEDVGDTSYWKGFTIVWKKGTKEEEKKKWLEELQNTI